MSNNQKENYANLPDELLEDILEDAPKIANKIKPLFEELKQQKRTLHQTLEDHDLIQRVGDLENPPSPSVAAIDGGQAIEKSIGADTLIAVAVGVEGLIREDKRKWGADKFDFHGQRQSIKDELNKAIALPKNRKIYFSYYKPHTWSPAYRIEMKENCAKTEIELAKILKAVQEQVVTTEIKEPYPQYVADMMAKSISGGLEALRAVIQYQFSDDSDFQQLLTQSYRT